MAPSRCFSAKEGASINPRIEKIDKELERNRTRIAELQTRNKDLERQRTELENAEIIAIVRGVQGVKGAPEDLSALLESLRGGGVPASGDAPPPEPQAGHTGDTHRNEEDDHEG